MNRIASIDRTLALAVTLVFLTVACDGVPRGPELPTEAAMAELPAQGPYQFSAPVLDIAAAPDGSILVAEGATVKEIRRGAVGEVIDISIPATTPPTSLNGLETIGRRSFFATTGGGDLATGAALWRVSQGGARMVADIEAFETEHDPDAFEGAQWKDQRCEAVDGFSAGAQSNPYHLTTRSGGEALVADAAGNTLLSARTNGEIDWVAVFTPPVEDGSSSDDPDDWMVRFQLDDGTDCYVQPVPTSVDIGPDGALYVGELTGTLAADDGFLPIGLSRVWRIEPGARNVVCPSDDCQEVISGLTSVIDLAFGPEGNLYVVEYDENSWLAVFFGNAVGGTISSCDVGTGTCSVVEGGLTLPGAFTFDKWGELWLLENNIGSPTVRKLDLP